MRGRNYSLCNGNRTSARVGLKADPILYHIAKALLAAEMALHGLNGFMAHARNPQKKHRDSDASLA
jgi:hypothetical protein